MRVVPRLRSAVLQRRPLASDASRPAPHGTGQTAVDPVLPIPPTANVARTASLSSTTSISPFCSIGPHSHLHAHTTLHPHAAVGPHVTLAHNVTLFRHASVGHLPQDLKYAQEPTATKIGPHTSVRDYAVVERGTNAGIARTEIGAGVLLMAASYVGHDAVLADNVIVANSASLAGHVTVGPSAVIGGHAAVHQRVRVGTGAMVGGMTPVRRDVVPFCVVSGNPPSLRRLNYRRLWPKLDFAHRRAMLALFYTLFPQLGNGIDLALGATTSLAARVDAVADLDISEVTLEFKATYNSEVEKANSPQVVAGLQQGDFLGGVIAEIIDFVRHSEGARGLHLPL